MSNNRIEVLDIFLLMVSCLLAAVAPFSLLVVGYVVLGPLHYLTEIVWLDDRQYFLPKRQDSRVLHGLAILGTAIGLLVLPTLSWLGGQSPAAQPWLQWCSYQFQQVAITGVLLAIMVPLVFWQLADARKRTLALGLVAVLGSLIYYMGDAYAYYLLLAVMIPTVIHVFLFTGLFKLVGALRGRSRLGVLGVILLIACAGALLLVDLPNCFGADRLFESHYRLTVGFVNEGILSLTGSDSGTQRDAVLSPLGMRLCRFLAFAYTYHYLNWFAKTSVIGWHKSSRRAMTFVICGWLISMALYCANYTLGLTVVGFLSLLHVFVEFPLNWLSIRGIARESHSIFTRGWQLA